jgi:hypothetical protein
MQKEKKTMNGNSYLVLAFFLAIFSLSSCEYVYDYTYQVKNETDSEISIEVKAHMIDSIYTIGVNETKILIITDHGVEGSKGPYFEDVSSDLQSFVVTKDDTIASSKNYLANSAWNFNEGLYSTIINKDEFK